MNKMKSLMLVGMAVVLAACSTAPSKPKGPDLTGTWILTTESPMGAQDTDMVVNQQGEQLSGTIASQMGTVEYKGTVTGGKDVAFGFAFDAQGMSLQIDYKGVVEGDTMKGTAKFGDFGEGAFTAKRKTS
jgi:hypothetical protein